MLVEAIFSKLNHSTAILPAIFLEVLNLDTTRRLGHKLVACAEYRSKVNGMGWIFFEFIPKLKNMLIYRSRWETDFIIPKIIQKFLTRDHTLGILNQEFQ